jgi:hypothetical protein
MRFLIVSDVDSECAAKLSEKFVSGYLDGVKPEFEAVILMGPFGANSSITTAEEEAIAEGEMASIIAQFENIVCRVIYLPTDSDPIRTVTDQLHLTPNSVNINARSLPLIDGLYVCGFAEMQSNLGDASIEEDSDDEPVENLQIQTSSSARIITDVMSKAPSYSYPNGDIKTTGIFMFNYKYVHTLNHFLFFQSELIHDASIKLAIVPVPLDHEKNSLELPKSYKGLRIVSPKSLRRQGGYSVVEVVRDDSDGGWAVTDVSEGWLDRLDGIDPSQGVTMTTSDEETKKQIEGA